MQIIASVITCPQRWEHYQRFLRNFAALNFGFPLRTFQTTEWLGSAFANNNLNARAALSFANRHLPENGWLLYLEDDVVLSPQLPALLPQLIEIGDRQQLDCWYLCNRKNPFERQCQVRGIVVNELAYPVCGSHGLLIPKRHLARMLAPHWAEVSDLAMFGAINHPSLRIWQVVKPILVEHIGTVSTYAPGQTKILETNYAT